MTSVTADDMLGFIKSKAERSTVFLSEFGIDWVRFDLIGINCYKRKVKIYEFKTSRADFQRDKKWYKYLNYCNSFCFVTCNGYIKREELPKGVGLLEITKKTLPHYDGIKDIPYLQGNWVKRPRGRELDQERYIKIISLMLNRAKHRPKDFF